MDHTTKRHMKETSGHISDDSPHHTANHDSGTQLKTKSHTWGGPATETISPKTLNF